MTKFNPHIACTCKQCRAKNERSEKITRSYRRKIKSKLRENPSQFENLKYRMYLYA